MSVRVVGAGVGRTGTLSLKLALERLLGGRCYHMIECVGRPADAEVWSQAFAGAPPSWPEFLSEFTATVDWPSVACWRQLSDAFPDALVLLSVRDDADAWWTSANNTIFPAMSGEPPSEPERAPWWEMAQGMMKVFTPDWQDPTAAKAAYERHNDTVRATIARDRLLEWRPGDGWEPICTALGVAVPDEPFPHVNTTEDFRAQFASDGDH